MPLDGVGTFYWYDLETSGINPAKDRIMQFAGQRTDKDLNPVGKPLVTYVQLPPEVLPNPDSCLITGITPQMTHREGLSEWEALHRIHQEFEHPQTTIIGFNNISFDDEFIRYGLYRNLFDPYRWSHARGNSRSDLLPVVWLTRALRPDGISWPAMDGLPVYRLEVIAAENGLRHNRSHDAGSDVEATIGLAQLIKKAQPKLWAYAQIARQRARLRDMLDPAKRTPVLHVSYHYSNERFCIAPIVPIAAHPSITSRIIVVNLLGNISALESGSADEIRRLFYTPASELDDPHNRPPLSWVADNKADLLAPISTLDTRSSKHLQFDQSVVNESLQRVLRIRHLENLVREVFRDDREFSSLTVAEEALYDGFIPGTDQRQCNKVQNSLRRNRIWKNIEFEDSRCSDLAQRLKVRLFPEQVTDSEMAEFQQFVKQRLSSDIFDLVGYICEIKVRLSQESNNRDREMLQSLKDYAEQLGRGYGILDCIELR